MKTWFLYVLMSILWCVPAVAGGLGTLTPLEAYEKGRAAFYWGDMVTARGCFERVLQAKPDFDLAKAYLAQVAATERELAKIPRSLKVARAEVTKQLELRDVALGDAIDAVRRELERAGGGSENGKVMVSGNLAEATRERKITLSMAEVKLDQALEALDFAGGVRITYTTDGFAVRESSSTKSSADAGNSGLPSMEAAAKKLVIERFVMDDASIFDALSYLSRKAASLSGGKHRPAFVVRHDSVPQKGISLDLHNVSVLDAVRSVCVVAGLKATWFPWGAGIALNQLVAPAAGTDVTTTAE